MIISKIIKKHNFTEVYSEGVLLFKSTENYIIDNRIFVGEQLQYSDYLNHLHYGNVSILEQKCIAYCASKIINSKKLIEFIKKKSLSLEFKPTSEDIAKIIEKCKLLRILNDNIYYKSKAESLVRAKKGINVIKGKLQQEGASKNEIDEIIYELNLVENSNENLETLINKKKIILEKKYSGYDLNSRIIRFALSRGFEMSEIKKYITN